MFKKTQQTINKLISDKLFNGAVIKITKNNQEIFHQEYGYNDLENNILMRKDNIFLLYSMSKPITVAAALILVQRNQLSINDSVQKFYPKFNKNITIKNLLTMTSGVTYFWDYSNASNQLKDIKQKIEKDNISLQEFCELMSEIDWELLPNEHWQYGLNLDILGGIIESITNQSFASFLDENIFKPLEMKDTAFYIVDESRHTIVYDMIANENHNMLRANRNWSWMLPNKVKIPNAAFGGHGIFSTTNDYAKFLNMLLTGKHQDKQILNTSLIKEMSSDQIFDLKGEFNEKSKFISDYTYGYGVRVRIKNELTPLTEVGEFAWDGALGSASIVDPKNQITVSFMVSSFPGSNRIVQKELFGAIYEDLRNNHTIK